MGSEIEASLATLAAQAREQIAALRRAQELVSELTVLVASADGLIQIEVGAQGQLRSLRLDAAVYERMPAQELAEVITGLVRDATARAAEEARAIMAPVLPEGLPGGREWWQWLPDTAGPRGAGELGR